MVDLQHMMDIVECSLETTFCLISLSEIQLALTNHLCYIMKTDEIVLTSLSEFLIEGVGLTKCHIIAFHVAEQTEIVLTGIVKTLQITLIIQIAGFDISQLVIETQRLTIRPTDVIGDGTIENAPDL